eukprot:scaffold51561_cov16-Tisochrysis_lutea.AAC.1
MQNGEERGIAENLFSKPPVLRPARQQEFTPLYKKSSITYACNYRMLAVSGTFYRLKLMSYALCYKGWCLDNNKIADSQFVFFLDRAPCSPFSYWDILSMLRKLTSPMAPHACSQPSLISDRCTIPVLEAICGTTYNNVSTLITFST